MHPDSDKPVVNLPPKELPIEPITLHEVDEEIKKRMSMIDHEFNRGFDFIKSQPKSVTIFGSARFTEDNPYYQLARNVGAKLGALGYSVITGGGPGIMEAGNRGAFEANGKSLGLTIKLPNEQVSNPYLTDSVDFYYFFVRKVMLSFSAEAYIVFPGGFGTFDELFEILTLVQTNKIERVPVILVGKDFWTKVVNFLKEEMCGKLKAIDEQDLSLFTVTDDVEEIAKIVQAVPVRDGVRLNHSE